MPKPTIEVQRTAWGVREEILPVLAAAKSGKLLAATDAEAREQIEALEALFAATRGQRVTGGIAVITLTGIILPEPSFFSFLFGGGGGLRQFRAELREALANDDIGSILIDVDSPGGAVDLVPETAAELRAARGIKPIVAIANTAAASAAYWIASQADELVVTPSGQVGSIGVFAVHEDWSGFNEQFGVAPTYISAGRFKTERNPDAPLGDEALAAWQQIVDEYYDMFVADVAAGRGASEDDVRAGFGEGRMVTAKRAVELGMADRVDTFEGTVARMIGGPGAGSDALASLPHAEDTTRPEPPEPKTPDLAERARIAGVLIG
jgi:signal peptide peptidase SppA